VTAAGDGTDGTGGTDGTDGTEDAVRALEAQMTDLWRRGRAHTRALARRVHPQLDPATYVLLAAVLRHGPARLSALAVLLEIDKSTASRQVDAAVRLGLAVRRPDPADARARVVALTAEGAARLEVLRGEQLLRWRGSLASWPAAELRTLTELLRRLGDTGVG
jgi:DNA-binding MarR family transcriptional regulator